MMNFKTFPFVLALATAAVTAVGCAASAPGDPGSDMPGGPGSDGSGTDDAPKPLDLTGTYAVSSTFDIASNMPGTVGDVTNQFIDATDSPDDPTLWIVDLILAQLPNGTVKTLAQNAEPFVVGYLNDEILQLAPDFVTTIKLVGNDFGDMTKHFGLVSTLQVSKTGTNYSSIHTITGAHFKIDTVESDYAFADYGMDNVTVPNVGVTVDATGKVEIASHAVPLSYGKILRIGLDAAIIPLIDPNAANLDDLLHDLVDCQAVGQAISDAVGFGSAGTYETACNAGLSAGAKLIYNKIEAIDGSALNFQLAGTAKAFDKNADGKVDSLATGKWDGTLSYASTPAPLSTATFTGSRM